ncbi:hypothetical protein Tco_1417263 [Tanacetum coccineum]
MGPPPATLGSEKTVSFQKSILGPRPKHIIVNKAKVPVASDNEVKQFYKPLSKPEVGFSKPNFRSKTPPPRRVNNNDSRPKTPQPKRHIGRQNQPHGFPICLGVDLEPDEWIKDSGCSKHMTGKPKLSPLQGYNGSGNVIYGSNFADRYHHWAAKGQYETISVEYFVWNHDSEITKDGKIIGIRYIKKDKNEAKKDKSEHDIGRVQEIKAEGVYIFKWTNSYPFNGSDDIFVTCGGPHPYYECLATDSNTFNAYAATGTYNQGGNGYRPQGDPNYRASNQMGPPGFPPPNVQNNQNYNRYNQNQGNNQGRGKNFNQGNNNYQAPNFQAPNYQAQVGPSNELTNYMKSNKATLRAMQTQMTNMKTELRNEFKSSLDTRNNKIENQNNQIMNMLTNLTMQKQNPSGSGSLPSNTVANPRGDVKAITTRSGVAYDGPTIPPTPSPLPKEVERETEATKDKVQTTSSESTTHVQPPVVQVPILEPEVAQKPNPKT